MSYLRYLCLFAHSCVKHISYSVFDLFFFILCALCDQFIWIVHFLLSLRHSLTFMLYSVPFWYRKFNNDSFINHNNMNVILTAYSSH
jgi:hypothetical protein